MSTHRAQIVQGLMGMLSLLFLMMITDVIELGMRGELSALVADPGSKGLWFIAIVTCLNLFCQMAVRTFDGPVVRRVVFGFIVLYTLVFVGHQVAHLRANRTLDIHFLLDLSHHALGVWAAIAAARWQVRPVADQTMPGRQRQKA